MSKKKLRLSIAEAKITPFENFFMSTEALSIYLTSQVLSPCYVAEIWSRSWILETGLL
jgi:hypothetical protein